MKTEKNKKSKKPILKIDSFQQFKKSYFPSLTASENKKNEQNEENYGNIIAMSILDGIRRDLSTSKK